MSDQPNIDDVKMFVSANTVSGKSGRECVDGRYAQDASGRIARPGGDFGYVMALLAVNKSHNLGLTPEQSVDAIYNYVAAQEEFYMHTDHHAGHDSIGCGHIAKAMNPEIAANYGVEAADVRAALNHIQSKGEKVEVINLDGDHAEKGVLIVLSSGKTINHMDTQSQYFVYDKTRDDAFIDIMIPALNIANLTVEEFKKASDLQIQATLHQLAFGKPIFQVDLTKESLEITQVGVVS